MLTGGGGARCCGCHREFFGQLDRAEARKGYPALVTAAFGEAVERRFGQHYQPVGIVSFVADVRKEAVTRAKLVLLGGLVADAQLDDAGLDKFLAAARKLADQLMS